MSARICSECPRPVAPGRRRYCSDACETVRRKLGRRDTPKRRAISRGHTLAYLRRYYQGKADASDAPKVCGLRIARALSPRDAAPYGASIPTGDAA